MRTAGALLQRAGFALPVIDLDRRIVRYDSALHLMRDLRAMGAANPLAERDRRPLRRAVLARAPRSMASASPIRTGACAPPSTLSRYRDGRRMRASRSRSDPAAPQSSCRCLKTVERPAGEKAGGEGS